MGMDAMYVWWGARGEGWEVELIEVGDRRNGEMGEGVVKGGGEVVEENGVCVGGGGVVVGGMGYKKETEEVGEWA
ncbi:hypothetical protein, partial [Paenibacillus xylanexedens]|uniref:hypothetical protein n=1 Tax=Paenibacillus xylanexedens TaxID=528191 RepID=UPI001C931823